MYNTVRPDFLLVDLRTLSPTVIFQKVEKKILK